MFRRGLTQPASDNLGSDRFDDGVDFDYQNAGLRGRDDRKCEDKTDGSQGASTISIVRKDAVFIGPIEGIMGTNQLIPDKIGKVTINGKKTNNRF